MTLTEFVEWAARDNIECSLWPNSGVELGVLQPKMLQVAALIYGISQSILAEAITREVNKSIKEKQNDTTASLC